MILLLAYKQKLLILVFPQHIRKQICKLHVDKLLVNYKLLLEDIFIQITTDHKLKTGRNVVSRLFHNFLFIQIR